MDRPYNRHFNAEQGTSILYFQGEDVPDVEAYVRGGICFPMFVETPTPDVFGFAVLGCQDIKTGIVTIYEQRQFAVVDNIIEDSKILHEGIASWFNQCWTKYYGRKFFYAQDFETTRKYRLDISRSVMIQPKPEIIELETYENTDMLHILWHYVKMGKVRYESGSALHALLKDMQHGTKVVHPAIHALQMLLCGIDRFPYRKKER